MSRHCALLLSVLTTTQLLLTTTRRQIVVMICQFECYPQYPASSPRSTPSTLLVYLCHAAMLHTCTRARALAHAHTHTRTHTRTRTHAHAQQHKPHRLMEPSTQSPSSPQARTRPLTPCPALVRRSQRWWWAPCPTARSSGTALVRLSHRVARTRAGLRSSTPCLCRASSLGLTWASTACASQSLCCAHLPTPRPTPRY